MRTERLTALRDYLGRDPMPLERVTWAQRRRLNG